MTRKFELAIDNAADHLRHGRYTDAEREVDWFFECVEGTDVNKGLLVKAHLLAARALAYRSEHTDAVKHCMEALRISEELKDVPAQADTMRWLGYVHWRKGDPNMAMECLEEGIKRAREVGDGRLEGIIRVEMSNATEALGDQQGAIDHVKAAIPLLEGADDPMELARAYNNLADSYLHMGEWKKAAELFKKSMDTSAEDVDMKAWASIGLGECFGELGKLKDARRELDVAIPVLKRSGDKLGLAYAFRVLGVVHAKAARWADAKETLEHSRAIMMNLGVPQSEGQVLRDLGRMYLWKGEKGLAKEHLKAAQGIFKDIGARHELEVVEGHLKGL